DNEPAAYSPDNVPYKPKKFFPISLEGVQPGDFTMVFGNPGSTMQYIPSNEVEIILKQRDPDRINIRDKKLEIFSAAMNADPVVRIQYAAKHATVSNAWKKWQGEILGLERLDAVNKKLAFEEDFKNWAIDKGTWESTYKDVFDNFNSLYSAYSDVVKASDYYSEIVLRGIEIFELAAKFNDIINTIEKKEDKIYEVLLKTAQDRLPIFYKDFNQSVDEQIFNALLPVLNDDLDHKYKPAYFTSVMQKHGPDKLLRKIYKKSLLTDQDKITELVENGNQKELLRLKKDPVIVLYNQLYTHYSSVIKPELDVLTEGINSNMKIYMAGIMEMKKGEPLYPDANLTLRVAYGMVEGFKPRDGVNYKYYTTLEGIIEKDNPEIYDYNVPQYLRDLYEAKDYGIYETNEGYLPVCFTASNHTTGGNSGSPVVNAKGHLIGVNFDRAWESTMSDIMYDPDMSRNIAIDIRYALFLIDKFAGAGYLLDEMELVGKEPFLLETN
ncbi:MAG TPA: S46 family peptidase, partial [Mariniphaga sp.]|nr:S46 family peptidase [Mariniphaga sp.]